MHLAVRCHICKPSSMLMVSRICMCRFGGGFKVCPLAHYFLAFIEVIEAQNLQSFVWSSQASKFDEYTDDKPFAGLQCSLESQEECQASTRMLGVKLLHNYRIAGGGISKLQESKRIKKPRTIQIWPFSVAHLFQVGMLFLQLCSAKFRVSDTTDTFALAMPSMILVTFSAMTICFFLYSCLSRDVYHCISYS